MADDESRTSPPQSAATELSISTGSSPAKAGFGGLAAILTVWEKKWQSASPHHSEWLLRQSYFLGKIWRWEKNRAIFDVNYLVIYT